MGIWYQQLQSGWRVARAQASNACAAALALMLAVGLSGAIFTAGGWQPILEVAHDSQLDLVTTPPSDPILEGAREITAAPVEMFTEQRNRSARVHRRMTISAPRRQAGRQSARQGQRFIVSTLLRLLRHRNHLVISKLFGSDDNYRQ